MKKWMLFGFCCSLYVMPSYAFETIAKNALLMDAETGYVMLDKKAADRMPPASMSKLMTAYMVFDALKAGRLTLDTEFTVSENAWRKGGAKSGSSTMFLNPGQKVKVRDLLRGIIVQSGNDACIVAAENMAGSEDVFAALMTEKAKELGLKNSTFKNATGLPHKEHRMTAYDLAILAQAIIRDFPEYYGIYSEKEFTFNKIKQGNRNPLLYTLDGADGLKTGHTEASGYGLTASVKSADGRRLILVINGLKSMKERSTESQKLVGWGLSAFENAVVYPQDEIVAQVPVWLGTVKTVDIVPQDAIPVTYMKGEKDKIQIKITYDEPVVAPVTKGQKLGLLTLTDDQGTVKTTPLVAKESVEKVGYFGKLVAVVKSWFDKE